MPLQVKNNSLKLFLAYTTPTINQTKAMYLILLGLSAFSFWLLLSGFWDNYLLLTLGLLSTTITLYIASRIRRRYKLHSPGGMLPRLPGYLRWLIYEVFKANVAVIKNIWLPRQNPISPTIKRIPMMQTSPLGQTAFANSITLTPGTVSFGVADNQVLVHAIVEEAIVELMEGEMNPRVAAMEGIEQ